MAEFWHWAEAEAKAEQLAKAKAEAKQLAKQLDEAEAKAEQLAKKAQVKLDEAKAEAKRLDETSTWRLMWPPFWSEPLKAATKVYEGMTEHLLASNAMYEAMDEVERLRLRLAKAKAEVERLTPRLFMGLTPRLFMGLTPPLQRLRLAEAEGLTPPLQRLRLAEAEGLTPPLQRLRLAEAEGLTPRLAEAEGLTPRLAEGLTPRLAEAEGLTPRLRLAEGLTPPLQRLAEGLTPPLQRLRLAEGLTPPLQRLRLAEAEGLPPDLQSNIPRDRERTEEEVDKGETPTNKQTHESEEGGGAPVTLTFFTPSTWKSLQNTHNTVSGETPYSAAPVRRRNSVEGRRPNMGGESSSPSSQVPAPVPELRTGSGKSAAANPILGREERSQAGTSTVTQQSESRQGEVAGRKPPVHGVTLGLRSEQQADTHAEGLQSNIPRDRESTEEEVMKMEESALLTVSGETPYSAAPVRRRNSVEGRWPDMGGESSSSSSQVLVSVPELRTGSGKSAAANTILSREERIQAGTSTVTQQSESRQGEVAGRKRKGKRGSGNPNQDRLSGTAPDPSTPN